MTQNALTQNNEWNIKLSSLESGKIINDAIDEFNNDWNNSVVLTEEWIQNYELNYAKPVQKEINTGKNIVPNKMQIEALRNLDSLRSEGQRKALLVSSTGARVIIVTGCINALVSRVSETFIKNLHLIFL